MITQPPATHREFVTQHLDCDLVIVGGGMAGTCCAITAARAGIKVVLIQDRPVLGGNASSEVRLWILGATSHMNNNNRWAREGGVLDEILVENVYRNPEGNPIIVDTILLEMVLQESNITLLLNTAVFEVSKSAPDVIEAVRAFCSQNSTMYVVRAPLFCDASGDGVVGFLSGAAFRMGAESTEEFGEKYAPSREYGHLLGHSLYFYTKDVGKPVKFVPPSYALDDITRIPRYRSFNTKEDGCRLWWIEYGGRLDTVHDTETIKWELWKVVYGVWNYIKNSGAFPDADTLTLEWVGLFPGKRESRRFEGAYILRQQDIVDQQEHDDAVSFGGWAIDLHPGDGVFSEKPGCEQWHARGVYQIPYRCMYSRNIANLFLAGRIISASHVAFGSTRVMATVAHAAQAVGMAAALCAREGRPPADFSAPSGIRLLQRELLRRGQYIPGCRREDPDDLAQRATITATSRLHLDALPPDGPLTPLKRSMAQVLPLAPGRVPRVTFCVDVARSATLRLELRTSARPGNFTPDKLLDVKEIALEAGAAQHVTAEFAVTLDAPCYAFYCLMRNEHIAVRCSNQRLTGVLSVVYSHTQAPEHDIGIDSFEIWTPQRRPGGHNLAIQVAPPIDAFDPSSLANGVARPTTQPNAWVADFDDPAPAVSLQWAQPQTIGRLDLVFDTDFDHPMESVLMGHPERVMPFCARRYRVVDGAGHVLAERHDNHQTTNVLRFDPPVITDRLVVEVLESHSPAPAALFETRCYAPDF